MPKRARKRPKPEPDINQIGGHIVVQSTNQTPADLSEPEKYPAAVEWGRLRGSNGGPARKAILTKAERLRIARDAAQAKWNEYNWLRNRQR